MPIIAIGSFLLGALLGARFGFYILVPAISLVVLLFVVPDLIHGSALGSAVIHSAVAATGMQLGYLGAALCRSLLVHRRGSRLTPHRGASLKTSCDQA